MGCGAGNAVQLSMEEKIKYFAIPDADIDTTTTTIWF